MILVVPHLVFLIIMVEVVWFLRTSTSNTRNFVVGLVVIILCCLVVWMLLVVLHLVLLLMVEVVWFIGPPT